MSSVSQVLTNKFLCLNEKWNRLDSLKPVNAADFNKLYEETLQLILDYRFAVDPQIVEYSVIEEFKKTLTTLTLPEDMLEIIANLGSVEQWGNPVALTLLSGKFISRATKPLQPLERKLLMEADEVVRARIKSLMEIFENNNSDQSSQMIINCIDTYKKFLIFEPEFQNKVSCQTIESLVRSLLIMSCHRKEFDHLNSMIKFLPRHRKIKFIKNEITQDLSTNHSKKQHNCQLFIAAAIGQDLIQSEFEKPIEQQSILTYNLYVNLLIDLATKEKFLDRQLEKILLSANDMDVISDYYYLVASLLRLKMPNRYEKLVVTLISIGISHDLTHLEQIKYTKEGDTMKWTEKDFIDTHRKMFQALTTLGFIIKNYSLRRLCIQAASVCEPSTKFCFEILKNLPEGEPLNSDVNPAMETVLLHLREQLETFQSAIKMNILLPTTWDKASIMCYQNLNYLNRRVELEKELEPIEYPGVERYVKRQHNNSADVSETTEKKPLDTSQILKDSTEFAKIVSSRLKQIKDPFKVKSNLNPPNPSVINAEMINTLRNCLDFEIECGQIFMKFFKDSSLESLKSYNTQYELIQAEQMKLNKPNLCFDFEMTVQESRNPTVQESSDPTVEESSDPNVKLMYEEGTIRVNELCLNGCKFFDIENVMIYALMEKKMKFIQSEFVNFNQNVHTQESNNQVHHAFNYLICRPQPEFSKIKKAMIIGSSANMLEYNLSNYSFDATPCQYKFSKKKNLDLTIKDAELNRDEKLLDQSIDTLEEPISLPPIKTTARKSHKVPKITPPKEPSSKKEGNVSHLKGMKEMKLTLDSAETFKASEQLLGFFLLLQNELSLIAGEKVVLDLKQMIDESSPHKVELSLRSELTKGAEVKVQKRRNHRLGPFLMKEISWPVSTHGTIVINLEISDEIVYDENLENPRIKSTQQVKLNGCLTLYDSSHNIKNMLLSCSANGIESKIKISLRNEHKAKLKKAVKTNISRSMSKDENRSKLIKKSHQLSSPTEIHPTNTADDNKVSNHANFPASLTQLDRSPVYAASAPMASVSPMVSSTHPVFENYSTTNIPSPPWPYDIKNISPFVQSSKFSRYEQTDCIISYPADYSQSAQHFQTNNVAKPFIHSLVADSCNNFPPDIETEPVLPKYENNNIYDQSMENLSSQSSKKVKIISVEDISSVKTFGKVKLPSTLHDDYNTSGNKEEAVTEKPLEQRSRVKIINFTYKEPKSGFQEDKVNEGEMVDFDEILPSTQVVKAQPVSLLDTCLQEQTPPTSPPPLHYHKDASNARKSTENISTGRCYDDEFGAPADRILNFTPPDEVIDLTEDTDITFVSHTPKRMKPRIGPASRIQKPCPAGKKAVVNPIFVSCDFKDRIDMLTTEVDRDPSDLKKKYCHVLKRQETTKNMKFAVQSNGAKRCRLSLNDLDPPNLRETEVHLVNIFKNIDLTSIKKDLHVEFKLVKTKLPENLEPLYPNHHDYQIKIVDVEHPIEELVTDVRESTFHIICHRNLVSYSVDQSGDGYANKLLIANNQCNEDISRKPKLLKKSLNNAFVNNNEVLKMSNPFYVDNMANDKIMGKYANVDLSKTFYSNMNKNNFTKNLKNFKKFSHWTPRVNNDFSDNVDKTDKFNEKLFDKDKDLLYQLSHDVFDSIPGLNSFEFFQFPSTPRRMVHVKVIHVFKDMKNTSISCDTSDTDGEQHLETNNLQSESFNGETSHASSTHVQRIGQTSINRENDPKTIQTSFGSIIKNTYPPATLLNRSGGASEIIKTIEKEPQKYAKLKSEEVQIKKVMNHDLNAINKANSNIKIVACSSGSSQIDAQKNNRNQTLINMLTQQVMLPTNSNRHFIITSNKADVTKSDNNITTVTSSLPSQQNVKKVITSPAQSQLVQILNSPPTSFTMKSMNTTTATTQAKPLNQVVTVASQGTNNSFKAELPTAVKQQGIVQFICKTDGKIIHLTPICNNSAGGSSKKITYKVDTTGAKGPTILHHANQQIIINNPLKKSDNQNILTIIQKQDDGDNKSKGPMLTVSQSSSTPASPISTRSIYEETYAKFIQTSSTSKSSDMGLLTISSSPINTPITSSSQSSIIQKIGNTVIQQSGQALPKFNHAFGKTVFTTNTSINEQLKSKIVGSKETLTSRQIAVDTKPVTKLTRTVSEIKSTDAGTLLSLIENDGADKQLPTLQTALQSNLLYARPIGNGKLLASNSNNVLLTALRSNNQSNNVRIITSVPDNVNRSSGAIMAPMRISVPIQIPKLMNTSVRPQSTGNFRQQIVIATTPTRMQQTTVNSQQTGSKLESLLMTSQPAVVKQEAEAEQQHQVKIEQKQKKNVDHSTLEQLREFDMVLEQVLERSSSEVTASTSMSSPPTPESVNHSSPSKHGMAETKIKTEIKLNSVTITSISPSVSPSPKSVTNNGSNAAKAAPKLQEDEHTAQRILDILANYKEQVRNSPDLNNKPAPRRRANPPTNPPVAKRKKIIVSGSLGNMKTSSKFGSTSDMMTDTMGSEEDSSCGMGSGVASTGSMNNSPQPHDIDDQTDVSMDNNFYMEDLKRETALSPQSSNSSIATSPSHNRFPINRRLILTETKVSPGSDMNQSPNKNIVITSSQPSSSCGSFASSIERTVANQGSTAVLMPGNYLLPMNVLKGGQQLAILSSNNGQKIIAVPTNQLVGNSSGTSIILQRYLNQANEAGNKTVISSDVSQNAFKSVRPQQSPSVTYVNNKMNSSGPSANTLYIRPIQNMSDTKTVISNQATLVKQEDDATSDSQNSKFVSDKTLITEIIQQQQQLSHTHQHPQQNFMIKLNEHQPSDPRSSSSIMFVPNTNSVSSSFVENKDISLENPKIKIEEIDYDEYMKEDAIDLLNDNESIAKSPMLNTKIEIDENTNSNHESNNLIYENSVVKLENEQEQKFQHFPIILNSCHGKTLGVNHITTSKNIKGFLIDPANKIVMYNDRKPATIEKEFFNQKSFSEECADLGVDEPIASDLFPEADLLFDSGSPKFDQINSHDGAMHIKKELENGQVLLEMNYNHNMETESWLNFDTEEYLVDGSHIVEGGGGCGDGHSGDLKAYF